MMLNPIIYRDDPIEDFDDAMEFRLTYEGKLASTRSRNDPGYESNKVKHKHEIRKHFHKQLKNLWEFHPILKSKMGLYLNRYGEYTDPPAANILKHDAIVSDGFSWVPLINEKMAWECDLDILYLRNGARGSVLNESDIDNRMKTLLDALKMPKRGEIHDDEEPDKDETPFFTLLDDDKVVSRLAVETDMLFSPTGADRAVDSRIVIKVKAKPYVHAWMWDAGCKDFD